MDYIQHSRSSATVDQNETTTPAAKQANSTAHAQNFSIEIPSASKSASKPFQPVVAIPQPADFRRADYAAAPNSPKRRKLHHNDREAELALRLRTQKEQGDTAVIQLQSLLVDVFDVRDRIELEDDSFRIATGSNHIFEPSNDDDDFKLQFTAMQLARLHTRFKALIDLKRLDDIPNDHISQLRQLCEGPVRRLQSSNLRLNRDPSEEDIDIWQSKIKSAEIGAASASVILLTAMGSNGPEVPSDLLQAISTVLVNAFESGLIPVIEARPDSPSADLFKYAVANEKILRNLLEALKKLLDQLATACVQVKGAAECLNATEFLAARLIFVQNGHSDKVAALGVKTYERARKQVMSSLARLFAAFPGERKSILDEILSSVDKLPSTSRSARQFPLGEGKSIMLVTALFVQLVQSSALGDSRQKTKRPTRTGRGVSADNEDSSSEDAEHGSRDDAEDELSSLRIRKDDLLKAAAKTSSDIVTYLVGKASKVTKTGDSPYRNILDLFVEDLVTLMPIPDWPATLTVLERMCVSMIYLAQNEKAAGVKNMALESLGTMGAGIANARASAQASAAGLLRDSGDDSETSRAITQLANDHFTRGLSKEEVLGPDGPFALTCLYYNLQDGRKEAKSLRARSAQSFYLAQYAHFFCQHMAPEGGEEAAESVLATAADILEEINIVAVDGSSISFVGDIHVREANLAYLLSIMSGTFCRRYESIAQTLLASLNSDQAQVRARSLKSIVTMLETDLSLLELPNMRIEQYVFPCASDESASVRDAALSLIAKFLIAKPTYEERGIRQLIQCAQDEKIGVKKRAIGHLAEIYAADHRPTLKTTVAETFLLKTMDGEDSVSELAKRTLADAWFTPNLGLAERAQESAQASVALEELTLHIADTLDRDLEELPTIMTKFFVGQLKVAKTSTQLGLLLTRIVTNLFNLIVAGKAKSSSLRLLVSLAQARPESIAATQLSHLRQYIKNLSSADDIVMFRAVIDIFRHVLPRLSHAHRDLLGEIQGDLFITVPKLPQRVDLDNVMSCLHTIDNVLHNSLRFVKLLRSIVEQLRRLPTGNTNVKRLVFIVGSLAKHIDVDKLNIKGHIDIPQDSTLSALIADLLYPFAQQTEFEDLHGTALDSLGCVCQAWPAQFQNHQIRNIFLRCLELPAGSKSRSIALKTFEELFSGLSDETDREQSDKDKAAPAQDLKKMGGNAKAQSDNSAIQGISQAVFTRVVKIALSTSGSDLLLAARTVTSMSRRGTFHPKDYAGVFVALETSDIPEVRAVVEQAHSKAHTQHESFWEREYMQAVQSAFRYQQQTAQEPSGIRQGTAKLAACFNIINTSGSKYVKKFLSNLISRLTIDRAKMDLKQKVPTQVLFVRFVVQNIAFFDFARMEDLLHAILQLDLLFGSGNEISETIETTLPIEPPPVAPDMSEAQQPSDALGEAMGMEPTGPRLSAEGVDLDVLRRLAAAACAMTMISEARSHLKRQYGISRDVRALMQQSKQAKEGGKPPVKVHGITGERFVNSTSNLLQSMETPAAMLERCRDFHRLMSIDEDVVVGEDGEGGLSEQNELMAPAAPRGRKRKSGEGSTGGTPRKRGRPRKTATPTRRSSSASSHNDPDADFMG
jgi:cohesin loading factor subunit SCC2